MRNPLLWLRLAGLRTPPKNGLKTDWGTFCTTLRCMVDMLMTPNDVPSNKFNKIRHDPTINGSSAQ
jgi:hypothetical protein